MADLRRPLAGTTLELARDRAPQVDNPKAGTKAALALEVDALRAEVARLRALAPAADLTAPPLLRVVVQIATTSEMNVREPWTARHKRRKKQREATLIALCATGPGRMGGPALLAKYGRLSIHIERRGGRAFDVDAIASSLKGVQDEVAAWLGCGDSARDPVVWSHSQTAHKRHAKLPDVIVEIRDFPGQNHGS